MIFNLIPSNQNLFFAKFGPANQPVGFAVSIMITQKQNTEVFFDTSLGVGLVWTRLLFDHVKAFNTKYEQPSFSAKHFFI